MDRNTFRKVLLEGLLAGVKCLGYDPVDIIQLRGDFGAYKPECLWMNAVDGYPEVPVQY